MSNTHAHPVVIEVFEAPRTLSETELDAARQILAAGRLIARRKAPYLRALLYRLVPRELLTPTPGFHTIGVTQNLIALWCPHYFLGALPASWMKKGKTQQKVTPEKAAGLLIHECLHVLNKHGKRRGARDPKRWNRAGDLGINPSVIAMGLELPEGGFFPKDFGWEEDQTADVYYTLLEKHEEEQSKGGQKGSKSKKGKKGQQPGQGGASGQGQQPGDGDEEGDGEGQGQPGNDPGSDSDGDGQGDGSPEPGKGWCGSCAGNPLPEEPGEDDPEGRSDGETDRACKEAAEAILDAARKGAGNVPLGLRRLAETVVKPPKVSWQKRLRHAARQAVRWAAGSVDHKYDAPSRRQAGVGFGPGRPVLARLRRPVPEVAIAVDTSGSMGAGELERAVAESTSIVKTVGASCQLCACDAKVHGLTPVKTSKDIVASLKGGGGTYFQPVFDALAKLKKKPDVVVFITDGGCFDKPVEPKGVKVIWLLVGKHREKPPVNFGTFIEVDEEEGAQDVDADADW